MQGGEKEDSIVWEWKLKKPTEKILKYILYYQLRFMTDNVEWGHFTGCGQNMSILLFPMSPLMQSIKFLIWSISATQCQL